MAAMLSSSFIYLDSKCIPYVFLLYYPVYSFVGFNKSSLQKKREKKGSAQQIVTLLMGNNPVTGSQDIRGGTNKSFCK